jgi:DNA-binding LacI/PurR family transcriptional regulator
MNIRDVAAAANVSPATVSLVLNNSASRLRISEATSARVRSAASRLGYRPNKYAKALRTNRSSTIGILAFDIVDPYCAQVMRGAESVITGNKHYPVFVDLQNDESKLAGYIALLEESRIEGLLILASSLQIDQGTIRKLLDEHIPLVVIGRKVLQPDVSTVVTDSEGGAYKAVTHLIGLGHRDIAFVLGPDSYVDSQLRRRGGEQALRDAGIHIRNDLLVAEQMPGWGPEAGYKATKELLATKKGEFTAVFAFDDVSAFGTIRALAEAGLNVPKDVSVVGFDDLSAAAFFNPPLTTVHYSMVNMGVQGAGLLFEAIRGQGHPAESRNLVAETRLIERKSTGPVRRRRDSMSGD